MQPNQTLELDLQADEWTERLAKAPIYIKKGIVMARQAEGREEIRTTLNNGTEETINVAEPGDVVVTNPGGEKYVLKADVFARRYESTDHEGLFRAKGRIRALPNLTGSDIRVRAPWGEVQHGRPDCMIATVCDPTHSDAIGSDRYLIGKDEFCTTYVSEEEISEKQNPR